MRCDWEMRLRLLGLSLCALGLSALTGVPAGATGSHDAANPVVTNVAVTFPSQGVMVGYTRPAPSDGSAAHFQAVAQGIVSPTGAQIAQEITLSGGVPRARDPAKLRRNWFELRRSHL